MTNKTKQLKPTLKHENDALYLRISELDATVENLAATILEKDEIIKALNENYLSMGETNKQLAKRLQAISEVSKNFAISDQLPIEALDIIDDILFPNQK